MTTSQCSTLRTLRHLKVQVTCPFYGDDNNNTKAVAKQEKKVQYFCPSFRSLNILLVHWRATCHMSNDARICIEILYVAFIYLDQLHLTLACTWPHTNCKILAAPICYCSCVHDVDNTLLCLSNNPILIPVMVEVDTKLMLTLGQT